MLIDQLNRQLDMHRRKLASLEKNVELAQKKVQKQRDIIQRLELEINQLSAESKTQQLQKEEIKQLFKKLELVTSDSDKSIDLKQSAEENQQPQEEKQKNSTLSAVDAVGVLVPLQELIINLEQFDQRPQKETKADGIGSLTKEEAEQTKAANTVEENVIEENLQPQEEGQKNSNPSDNVGVPQELMPLQDLILKLQQKITEINQRQQTETKSDEIGQLITEEAGQAEAAIAIEEQAAEKIQQLQGEEQKKSNLSAADILGGILPLQELVLNLQQKITEINQRQQKENKSTRVVQEQHLMEDEMRE